ncbi:hypothetical protein FB45DRAFT_874896 [Roridomyces roridus]|uniref:Uncharacterized protein n=1 Tax=Roridomyces roridus TaxID=1738132 RepID=A0AAD7FDL1_9AGAR|nr:hypothetical protein FB45DRAFT_874896 [Roridomyces roridus]
MTAWCAFWEQPWPLGGQWWVLDVHRGPREEVEKSPSKKIMCKTILGRSGGWFINRFINGPVCKPAISGIHGCGHKGCGESVTTTTVWEYGGGSGECRVVLYYPRCWFDGALEVPDGGAGRALYWTRRQGMWNRFRRAAAGPPRPPPAAGTGVIILRFMRAREERIMDCMRMGDKMTAGERFEEEIAP